RTLLIKLCLVTRGSPDEHFRHVCITVAVSRAEASRRRRASPAQNLETAQPTPHLQGLVIAPRQDHAGERRRRFLARALARKHAVADGHREFPAVMSVASG